MSTPWILAISSILSKLIIGQPKQATPYFANISATPGYFKASAMVVSFVIFMIPPLTALTLNRDTLYKFLVNMSLPCEFIAKYVIPSLRREIVRILSEEYEMSNREIAKKLDLTDAAVSQYLSGKRGAGFELNEKILTMVRESADRIARGKTSIDEEICKICETLKEKGDLWEK